MIPSPIAQKHSPTRVTCSPSAGYVELKQAVEAPKAGHIQFKSSVWNRFTLSTFSLDQENW